MTCDEVVQHWQTLLDDTAAPPDQTRRMTDHVAGCPRCRTLVARFDRLRAGLVELGSTPTPQSSPDARERFLLAVGRQVLVDPPARSSRRWVLTWTTAGSMGLAASLLAAIWVRVQPENPKLVVLPPPPIRIHLVSAWTDATSATLDLARGLSAPAARLGRDVLDREGERGLLALGPDVDLDRVDRLPNPPEGGRSSWTAPARRAFDFLLPDPDEADPPMTEQP